MVIGAIRSSWKPRFSLGIEGVASALDRNIEMNATRRISVQKPATLRPGRKKVKPYPMGKRKAGRSRLRRRMSRR
jgi:hypothetical protein